MSFKTVVNSLAFIPLFGLTAFGALTMLNFNDMVRENKLQEEKRETILKNDKFKEEVANLKLASVELTKVNETLEEEIVTRERILSDSAEILIDLENKKSLVVDNISTLESQKSALENILLSLTKQRDLEEEKLIRATEEGSSQEELLAKVIELQEDNNDLKTEVADLQSMHEQNKSQLDLLTVNLGEQEKRAKSKESVFKKEIVELTERITILSKEKNAFLNELSNKKLVDQKKLELKKYQNRELEIERKKEIEKLKNLRSNFEQLNGLRVIFSGNMMYDEAAGQIVFRAENSVGIPIFQDDFTGSIAGKCGLPIDREIENRCSATIIAEFVVENGGLFLRGREIVEILRK